MIHNRRSVLKGLAAFAPSLAYGWQTPPANASHSGARGRTMRVDGEVKEFRDPETGARVMRLTGDGSDNVHLYFTSEAFAAASDQVVFASNRSGRFQFYLLEIRQRRLTQLTDSDHIRPLMACMAPGGQLMYFDGPILRRLKTDTLQDHELYRVPEGWSPHLPTCTADGLYVAFAYAQKLEVSTENGQLYSSMAETFYQRPECVVMRVNTSNGEPVAAWGERMWISHVIIHPHEPNLILFCQEGGSLSPQRMWTVDIALRRGRKAEPLYVQKPNEYCVHEYFTRLGEVGFQYEVQREGRIEYYNCFIRPDGTWIRQYLLPGRRPGHIQSNTNNTLVVGDCGYLSANDKDGDKYISLMSHVNGKAQVRRLCRREPGETEESHGHPVFSLDDRWVLFNSRIGARDNIFMADVTSI
ncbi:MAG TPA: oligogalacturonate lyase family protein [Bryobacteraceae bacterium]